MQIKLIAIGKTDHPAIQILLEEYTARLGFYVRFELDIIPDLKNTKALSEQIQKEKAAKQELKKQQQAKRKSSQVNSVDASSAKRPRK